MAQRGVLRISAFYGGALFLVKAANFLLLPIYTHYLPPAEFGVYSIYAAAYAVLTAVLIGGLHSAFNRFYIPEDEEGRRRIFSFFAAAIFSITLISAVVVWGCSSAISHLLTGDTGRTDLVNVFAALMIFEGLGNFFLMLFKAREEVKRVLWYSLLPAIVTIGLTVWLVVFLRKGINGIALGQLAGAAAGCVLMGLALANEFTPFSITRYVKPVAVFALPFLLGGLFSTLADFGDRFLLDRLMTRTDVGMYSFVYRIGLIVNIYVLGFRMAWIPRALSEADKENYRNNFRSVFTKMMGTMLVIIILATTLFPYLFSVRLNGLAIFNPVFQTDRITLIFISIGYLFSGVIAYHSFAPFISGRSVHFILSDLFCAFINLALNVILIPMYGLNGAALATTLGFFAGAVYMRSVSKRTHYIPLEIGKLSLISGIAAAVLVPMLLFQNVLLDILLASAAIFAIGKVAGIQLTRLKTV